jgi:transcriptional antiterminator RfaH
MTDAETSLSSNLQGSIREPLGVGGAVAGSPGAEPAWYCAKTKPKHDHIAAANLRKNLGLEVFSPRLRSEQITIRGVIKNLTEPVFPGYVFVRCAIEKHLDQVRHTTGLSGFVSFGGRIPAVPADVLDNLRTCFGVEEVLDIQKDPSPGDRVSVAAGAFLGMQAVVLRYLPAKRRVQVLLEILGRLTPFEVDRSLLTLHRQSVAEWLPELAAVSLVSDSKQ